jgi:hypothetical protein
MSTTISTSQDFIKERMEKTQAALANGNCNPPTRVSMCLPRRNSPALCPPCRRKRMNLFADAGSLAPLLAAEWALRRRLGLA